jgi:hypothetical protein
MTRVIESWLAGWRQWNLCQPLMVQSLVELRYEASGAYWHRTGPREHVVHIIRKGGPA